MLISTKKKKKLNDEDIIDAVVSVCKHAEVINLNLNPIVLL